MRTSYRVNSVPHGIYPSYSSNTVLTTDDNLEDNAVTIMRQRAVYHIPIAQKTFRFFSDLFTGYESKITSSDRKMVLQTNCCAITNRTIIPQLYNDIPCYRFTGSKHRKKLYDQFKHLTTRVLSAYKPFPYNTTQRINSVTMTNIYEDNALNYGTQFKKFTTNVDSKVDVIIVNESLGDISLVFQKNEFFEIKLSDVANVTDIPDGVSYVSNRIKGSIEKSGEYNITVRYNNNKKQNINIVIPFYRRLK